MVSRHAWELLESPGREGCHSCYSFNLGIHVLGSLHQDYARVPNLPKGVHLLGDSASDVLQETPQNATELYLKPNPRAGLSRSSS